MGLLTNSNQEGALMTVAYWIVATLLALVYLYSGGLKVLRSPDQLRPMMGWIDTLPLRLVRSIGGLEVLGAFGLILPPLTGIAPALALAAATGFVLIQVGAISLHPQARRSQADRVQHRPAPRCRRRYMAVNDLAVESGGLAGHRHRKPRLWPGRTVLAQERAAGSIGAALRILRGPCTARRPTTGSVIQSCNISHTPCKGLPTS
jgi:DoxX-like family